MNKSSVASIGLLGEVAFGLSACAVGPSSKASDTPPRIVTDADKRNVWNNPALFGPVPANLQATGDQACQKSGFKAATGYHPKAEDINGKPIKDGAYFCVDK